MPHLTPESTTSRKPRLRWGSPTLLGWLAAGLLLVAVGLALGMRYPLRQAAGSVLSAKGASFSWRPGPLAGRIPNRWHSSVHYIVNTTISAHLPGRQFADGDIARLTNFPYLNNLAIDKTSISDAGVARLAHFRDLERLSLRSASISDDALVVLRDLPKLKGLDLSYSTIGDDGVDHILELSDLDVLSLNRTRITDAALAKLASLPNLRGLSIDGTKVTDAGLASLKTFPRLLGLSIKATPITDAGLVELEATSLRSLSLGGNNATLEGLGRLLNSRLKGRIRVWDDVWKR